MSAVEILIPTCERPDALAVTLTSLCSQEFDDFRVLVSDQTEHHDPVERQTVQSVLRVLDVKGHAVETFKHLPRRGIAEHRQFLLDRASSDYVLFLDDDLLLEPYVLSNAWRTIRSERCGFVGCAPMGLSYADDERPQEQAIEFWEDGVEPEDVTPGSEDWERWRLHNAANLYHVQMRLDATPTDPRPYKVAWVGGCVLYDREKLLDVDGFSFWDELPPNHCGEDVLVQLRLMKRFGGCGLLPSGVYHQELPTTITDREITADSLLDW